MEISGLDAAVNEYKKARGHKWFHGCLMFNTETGKVWNDFAYETDISWNDDYDSPSFVNLSAMIWDDVLKGLWSSDEITVENISKYLRWKFSGN